MNNNEFEKEIEQELTFFKKKNAGELIVNRDLYGTSIVVLLFCLGLSLIMLTTSKYYKPIANNNYYVERSEINQFVSSQIQVIKGRATIVANIFTVKDKISNREAIGLIDTFISGKELSNIPIEKLNRRITTHSENSEQKLLSLEILAQAKILDKIKNDLKSENPDSNLSSSQKNIIIDSFDKIINFSNMLESSYL